MLRALLLLYAMTFAVPVTANDVTYGAVTITETATGVSDLDGTQWMLIRYDIRDFRINGTCYNGCRLRFTLDGVMPAGSRRHIGIRPGETVRTSFPAWGADDGENRTGYIGQFPFPSDMNSHVATFAPDEKLALAWIVTQSQDLIEMGAAMAETAETAAEWRNDAGRFERDLRRAMPQLRPYMRTLE